MDKKDDLLNLLQEIKVVQLIIIVKFNTKVYRRVKYPNLNYRIS